MALGMILHRRAKPRNDLIWTVPSALDPPSPLEPSLHAPMMIASDIRGGNLFELRPALLLVGEMGKKCQFIFIDGKNELLRQITFWFRRLVSHGERRRIRV